MRHYAVDDCDDDDDNNENDEKLKWLNYFFFGPLSINPSTRFLCKTIGITLKLGHI